MTLFLGIDYGDRRIGLAVGDSETPVASPIATLLARGGPAEDVRAVMQNARAYEIDAYVVGLPLNMDGTEGEQAQKTRRFGDELARTTGKSVHFWDERLSTVEASDLLASAELTRKKRKDRLDRVAAKVILQGFLDQYPTMEEEPVPPTAPAADPGADAPPTT